ncbi:TetR family transcriptional regulator [Actinoplanes sp. SE50]|uniref:TetR/AcrR family transcriptional regulator n=1 Tax=unclassified Actinoplanes TaxID=2626549 RepID=UPI00023EBF8E|nr:MULTISPECIES: TetR/AcrR family transcriptional regulator [unclassified Actinoplanes]AEV86321.1 HTH-type protein slmA [Actinoplanes sp. SE50/110]ATO84718.1 TetR family transcriptional regulator [Actinoplanes sp. SE50]SLM02128.1 TetR family transcriptional regulator [Actinoplanes sp. SE50/110]
MPRPTKQQIDDEILDAAAGLFARHGFRETSVQRIADAVGYSKTGLLHRFPTKEALQAAVIERCVGQLREVAAGAAPLPTGPERDRMVITGVAQLARDQPGAVALLLSCLLAEPESEFGVALQTIGEQVAAAFGDEPFTGAALGGAGALADPVRSVRVIGALGALAVASVALRDCLTPDAVTTLVDVAYGALGHPSTL